MIKQERYKVTTLSWNICLMAKSYDLEHHIKTIINFPFSKGVWEIVCLSLLLGLDGVRESLLSPSPESIFAFMLCHKLPLANTSSFLLLSFTFLLLFLHLPSSFPPPSSFNLHLLLSVNPLSSIPFHTQHTTTGTITFQIYKNTGNKNNMHDSSLLFDGKLSVSEV